MNTITRLTYVQRDSWKAAVRMNSGNYPRLSDLRALWARIRAGVVYGRYSGYSP